MEYGKPLCYLFVILKKLPDVKGSQNIRKRIKQRLFEWNDGKFQVLTPSTILCAEAFLSHKRGQTSENDRVNFFLMLCEEER